MKLLRLLTTLIALSTISCYSLFIPEKRIDEINQEFFEKSWSAKSDIFLPYTDSGARPIFKKGDKLKIWMEITENWIKIKGFKEGENREQARGRTVLFIIMRDLKPRLKKIGKSGGKKAQAEALERHIREEIATILEPLTPRK